MINYRYENLDIKLCFNIVVFFLLQTTETRSTFWTVRYICKCLKFNVKKIFMYIWKFIKIEYLRKNNNSYLTSGTVSYCNFEFDLCEWTQLTDDDFDFQRIKGPAPRSNVTGPMADYSSGTGNCLLNKRAPIRGSKYFFLGTGWRKSEEGFCKKGEGPKSFFLISPRELNEFEFSWEEVSESHKPVLNASSLSVKICKWTGLIVITVVHLIF